MAEDYGRANGREWDLNAPKQSSPDDWQTVGGSKRPKQPQHRAPVRDPGSKRTALPQQKTPARGARSKQNASSRKWENLTGALKQQSERRPPPKLIDVDENEAQLSWRNREAPRDTIRIRSEAILQNHAHEYIAREHAAFVSTNQVDGNSSQVTFGIWGDENAVAATKKAITAHMNHLYPPSKSDRTMKFGKVQSLTPELRKRAEKKWKRDVERQKFRQCPPPDMGFGAIGSFLWPVQEYKVEEILGMSCEALDPIRMETRCYIIFSKDQALFKVMGKAESVKEGLLRIRKTCFQIAARQIPTARKYLLHWPETSTYPSHVSLRRYDHPLIFSSSEPRDVKSSKSPLGEGTHDDELQLLGQTKHKERVVMNVMLKTLGKLRYYRGNIQLRIHLGTFLVKQYMEPDDGVYPLSEYENMITMSQFVGQVTQELGNKEIEQNILSTVQGAKDLLSTQQVWNDCLSDLKPIYSVIFTFGDEAGDLRYSVSWQESLESERPTGAFDLISNKWTRLERDTGDTASIVDVILANLVTGMGWHFDMQAAQAVDQSRLHKTYIEFATSLTIDATAIRKHSAEKCFAIYRPNNKLKSIHQRMSYRYGILTTDYTLEITRFQDRVFPSRTSPSVLNVYEPTIYEPRWALHVYRNAWDTMFTDNERLAIGEGVPWESKFEDWFPKDDAAVSVLGMDANSDGFQQLMEMLKKVAVVVQETKQEDLVGGMAVG